MRRGEPHWGRVVIGFAKPRRRFRVLGNELAGEIDAIGHKVTRFAVGDHVFGFAGFNPGANADYICVPEKASLAVKPVNKSYEESAAVVDGATTALHFLRDIAEIQAGQRILVIGASGSIGTYAVQLAKRLGAHVTGVCSAANVDLVRSLGADEVIDYGTVDFTTRSDTYDIIFDTIGKSSFAACKSSLTPAGIFLPTVITPANLLQRLWTPLRGGKHVRGGLSLEKNEELIDIRNLLEANELRVVIERSYPLEQIADAHRHVDGGHKKGNIVITVDHQHSGHRGG
jgi:NADPH2:quinone reductase